MSPLTPQSSFYAAAPSALAPSARARPTAAPTAAAAPPALTTAEETRIAEAFPARPETVQRLYGPGREVQTPATLGARLDLSA